VEKLDIVLIVISVAVLLFVGVCIPVLIQIWRTAKSMTETLKVLNESLPLIMLNMAEITTNVNRTATTVHRQVEDLSLTLRRVQGVLGLLIGVEEVVRQHLKIPFAGTVRTAAALIRGGRVFLRMLVDDRRRG
jgi:uncharacterized protein YoxC